MVLPFQGKPRVPRKAPPPPPPEKKRDVSAFRGKPYLRRGEIREWLRGDEIYKIIPRSREGRAKLEKELFGPESGRYGSLIQRAKREPERLLKDIDTGKVKPPSDLTKNQIKELLKKFLGK